MALKKEYVVGVTVARLVLPLYIWGCPANVLSVDTSSPSSVSNPRHYTDPAFQNGSTLSSSTRSPRPSSSSPKTDRKSVV